MALSELRTNVDLVENGVMSLSYLFKFNKKVGFSTPYSVFVAKLFRILADISNQSAYVQAVV